MWLARDKRNNSLCLYNNKPVRNEDSGQWNTVYDEEQGYGGVFDMIEINPSKRPSLKWEDEPIEVGIFTRSEIQAFGDACYKRGQDDACAFEYGKDEDGNLEPSECGLYF